MPLTRFSVSLDDSLLKKFDHKIKNERCPTRSKAVADMIRHNLVEQEWRVDREVAGAIVLVYNHHRPDLLRKLTTIQHNAHGLIISTQHIHLDHDNCLEIVAVKGKASEIENLSKGLKSLKGLKHVSFAAGTTGRHLS